MNVCTTTTACMSSSGKGRPCRQLGTQRDFQEQSDKPRFAIGRSLLKSSWDFAAEMPGPMITYAQNFEDVMLGRVFRDRTDGFYVDVGAADPVDLSVTKWFYDLGWSGINIEPNPTFYQKLVAERPRDVNLNCGAGSTEEDAQYFQLPANELSSFDPDVRARAEAAGMSVVAQTVAVLPLTKILDRYGNGRSIDFLKIDVEGWEREVLTGLDLRRYRPTVIIVEATVPTTRIETHSKWEDLLAQSDYAPVHFDGLSRFYLPAERMDLKVHFELPPNIFDGLKTWQQAASEIELGRLREEASSLRQDLDRTCRVLGMFRDEASSLRQDLDRTCRVLGMFRDEAGRLSEVLADGRPAIADPEGSDGIDAIRRASCMLSSCSRLLRHALTTSMWSLRRRLSRRDG
jgi:FkbM family methyltransferase